MKILRKNYTRVDASIPSKITFAFIQLASILFILSANAEVAIPDPELLAAIRKQLDKSDGDITRADMESLIELDASYANRDGGSSSPIQSLEGMEAATNLETLDLSGKQFGHPLQTFPSLSKDIDLSPLRGLKQLRELRLSTNGDSLINLTVPEGFNALEVLDLGWNHMKRLVFSESLPNLTSLALNSNELTDISFLQETPNLSYLGLSDNSKIRQFSEIQTLTHLTELNLAGNGLTDIAFLKGLSKLERLYLYSNRLTGFARPEGLTSLKRLSLSGNPLNDPLLPEDFSGITHLVLRGIVRAGGTLDLAFLEGNSELQLLRLGSNQLNDLDLPDGLTGLKELRASQNNLMDVSFLKGLTNLEILDLQSNSLTEASLPDGLSSLEILFLSSNELTAFSLPNEIDSLKILSLYRNPLTSITMGASYKSRIEDGTLEHYFGDPAPQITYVEDEEPDQISTRISSIAILPNSELELVIDGPEGRFQVESSSNLIDWVESTPFNKEAGDHRIQFPLNNSDTGYFRLKALP